MKGSRHPWPDWGEACHPAVLPPPVAALSIASPLWAGGVRPSGDLNPIMMQPGATYMDEHVWYFQVTNASVQAQTTYHQLLL